MKALKAISWSLAAALVLTTAQAKPKKTNKLPAIFNQARFVYVEAVDGQEFDPRLEPDDRQAIADVDRALSDWNRYVLTTRREDADLILVVRKGRMVEGRVGVQVASPGQRIPSAAPGGPVPGKGVSTGGEVGPPDDLLEVYLRNPDNTRGALIWQHTLADGLEAPELTLFQQLKHEVESAYPIQTASKASKP